MQKIDIDVPVLFLVFNRPDKTQQVFNAIREAKPRKLYVAADAPRDTKPDEKELTDKVREIVKKVDWDCETHYLFHEKNLGCSLAGKTAWDWLFSQEEEMIFLEDDGLPSLSFFGYAQELLRKYKNNPRIAYIGGVNYGLKYGDASYFFTNTTCATYAMATWKRVYDLYDYDMVSYEKEKTDKQFKEHFESSFIYDFYQSEFDSYVDSVKRNQRKNTYDVQIIFLVRKYNMLNIYPNINLVSNIGLDYGGANNDIAPNSAFALAYGNRPRFELEKLVHPETINIDRHFEIQMFRQRVLYNEPYGKAKMKFYIYPYLRPIYHWFKALIGKK